MLPERNIKTTYDIEDHLAIHGCLKLVKMTEKKNLMLLRIFLGNDDEYDVRSLGTSFI